MKNDFPLLDVQCDSFAGLIFINQDKGAQPLRQKFGTMLEDFEGYPMDAMKILGQKTYEVDVDWKLLAENFMEWYLHFTIF